MSSKKGTPLLLGAFLNMIYVFCDISRLTFWFLLCVYSLVVLLRWWMMPFDMNNTVVINETCRWQTLNVARKDTILPKYLFLERMKLPRDLLALGDGVRTAASVILWQYLGAKTHSNWFWLLAFSLFLNRGLRSCQSFIVWNRWTSQGCRTRNSWQRCVCVYVVSVKSF